ncbi:MAG: hypothetical protein V4577_04355 [Bacteroidota bacterium]
MKQTIKIILLSINLVALATIAANAQTVDFSGTWKVNKETSDPGGLSINSIPIELVIQQDKNQLVIARTSTNVKAEIKKDREVLKTDGSVSSHSLADSTTKKSVAKWNEDHKTLAETATYTDTNGKEVKAVKKTWAVLADGKTLHISVAMTVDGEDYTLEEYFDKQ